VRDGSVDYDGAEKKNVEEDNDGPYVRDAEGRIVRDEHGIPTLKAKVIVKKSSPIPTLAPS